MNDFKEQYAKVVTELEKLTKHFEKLEQEKVRLKRLNQEYPDDSKIKEEIKNLEEKYKEVYERMLVLSVKAKELEKK